MNIVIVIVVVFFDLCFFSCRIKVNILCHARGGYLIQMSSRKQISNSGLSQNHSERVDCGVVLIVGNKMTPE